MRLSFLLTAICVVSGCVKKGGHLDYGLDIKETIRININQEPPTIDWYKAADTTSGMIINNIMDRLVAFDLADPELKVKPSLATAWTPSAGGRLWTFDIRKGVKWTDGVELTAEQFVDGWEYLLNPNTAAADAYYLFPIKNARAYNSGKIKDFSQVGIKSDKKGHLIVELESHVGYFPMMMTHPATGPARKELIAKFGPRWTDPQNLQTLGPYRLKYWDHDKSIVLERFDGYWGEKALTKNVIAYMINEYSTALNLFDSGKLDFQETIPFKEVPRYKDNPGYYPDPALGISFYGLNTRKPPFDNVKVRQAFSYAIDRKQITDLLNGGQAPLSGWVPKGMFGYNEKIGIAFDREKASKLLDEAGFKDRSKFPRIHLAINTNENHLRVAENVQAQLKKNLGIQVELSNEEWKVYLNHLHTDPPEIFRMGYLGNYPDPDDFMNLMTSYSENNFSGWKNDRYDELIKQGRSEMDRGKRLKIYDEAQKILTQDDVGAIPIFSAVQPILLGKRVKGFQVNAMNRWLFSTVSLQ